MFISPFRRLTGVGTLLVLLGLIFGLWYVTNPKRMGRLAETLLSNVVGGRVTVQRAHLSLNGTLLLSGVELKADERRESGSSSRRFPIFSADQIEARFDWLSLLSGQLTATQLTAIRPTLYLVEDTGTEQWNYERLGNGGGGGGGGGEGDAGHGGGALAGPRSLTLPVVLLRDARVLFAEVREGETRETSQTFVDGELSPEPNVAGVYRFKITPHGRDFAGMTETVRPVASDLPAAPLPSMITGTWDVAGNRIAASAERLQLSEQLAQSLPRSVRDWWTKHQLAGTLSQLRVTFDADQGLVVSMGLEQVSLMVQVEPPPAAGAGPSKAFDVPLKNVRGGLTFGVTKPGLKVTKMSGRVLTYNFEADAEFRGASPESPFDLSLRFKDAFVPHDYPPLFMAVMPVQELLQRTGIWGNFDLALSVKRLTWSGKVFFDGLVNCKGGHMRFCHFPFPLDDLRGEIQFDNQNVTFKNVTGRGDENIVTVAGTVGTTPIDPHIDLTVSSKDATFDDRVAACLPDKFRQVWDQFSLQGRGGFVCTVKQERGDGTVKVMPTITVDLTVADGRGYMKAFPYRFYGAKGHLHFAAEETLIDNVTVQTGEDRSGMLTFNGVVKHVGAGASEVLELKPELRLNADVPVDAALLAVFPESMAEQVDRAVVSGRATFVGTVQRGENPIAGTLPAEVAGEMTLRDGTLKMKDGSLSLGKMAVAARIDTTAIKMTSISAETAEGVVLSATGKADIPAGTAQFDVTAVGKDLELPKDPPAMLPNDAKGMWKTYKPAGKIDVTASARVMYPATSATTVPTTTQAAGGGISFPAWIEKPSLTVGLKELSLQNADWPDAIHGITGTVSVSEQKIALDKIHATSGPVTVDFFASEELKTGAWTMIGTGTADKTPHAWLAKLPAAIANTLSASKPEGSYKLTVNRLDRAATGKPWAFDATLATMTLTTSGPMNFGAERLSIVLNGTYDPAASALDATGVLAGTNVSVSGKPIDTLTAAIASNSADKTLKFTDIDGKAAGGSLQGSIVARLDENPRYQADLSLNDAELARLMLPPTATDEDRKKIGTGRVSVTLALQQTFGDKDGRGADRTGRGDMIVRDGKIYNVPLAMGLIQLVTLRLPVSRSFDHATMSYYLRDNKVTFERILLESSGINLAGMGSMSMKSSPPTLNLNFVTESPNELHLPLVTDIINITRSELLQVSVTGSVDDPKITPVPLNPIASTLKALLPKKKEK